MPAGLLQDPYAMFTRGGWKAHDDWEHRRADALAKYFAENRKANPFLSGKPLTAEDMMGFVGSTGPAKGLSKLRWEKGGQSTFLPKESALKRLDPDTGEELTAKYVAGGGGPDKGLTNAEAAGLLDDVADVWAHAPALEGYGKQSALGKNARKHAIDKLDSELGFESWSHGNRIRDSIDEGMRDPDTRGFALATGSTYRGKVPQHGAGDMSYVWLQNADPGAKSSSSVPRLIKEVDADPRLSHTMRHETGHVLNSRSGLTARGGELVESLRELAHPVLRERNLQNISLLDGKVHTDAAAAPSKALTESEGNLVLRRFGIKGAVRDELLKLGRMARPRDYQWYQHLKPEHLKLKNSQNPASQEKYKKYVKYLKEHNDKFQREYLTTLEEILADATALYQTNPKLVKEVAPNAARWIREKFNKSLTKDLIQFGSMAAPVGALGLMGDRYETGGGAGLLQSGQEY